MPKLSVLITSYDQPEITALHVDYIMRSSRLPDEIIVVNDHGPQELKGMLEKIEKKCPVIYAYINEDIPWNYTGARNLAFWLSTGDYIAMEDADHIPFPNVYEEGLKFMEKRENKKIGRLIFHTRHKVYKDDALKNPPEKWTIIEPPRGTHYDTQIMRRGAYIRIKGCDERFAGKYAWACTDWRRRLARGGVKHEKLYVNYYVVLNGETETLERRRSKENYSLAKQREGQDRFQSPAGILNFTYTYEKIR